MQFAKDILVMLASFWLVAWVAIDLADRQSLKEVDEQCKKLGYTKAVDTTWCVKLHENATFYQKLSTLERLASERF